MGLHSSRSTDEIIMKKILPILFLLTLTSQVYPSEKELDCTNVITTRDTNRCEYMKVLEAEKVLQTYVNKSVERWSTEKDFDSHMKSSQETWLKYREAQCGAVYNLWITGTIRGLMSLQCKLDLTKKRTHDIWVAYLTYMDSTPAILPNPYPTSPNK